MCLRICFVEAISIPENNSPIYTMAMRDIVMSVSNLNPKEKVNHGWLILLIFILLLLILILLLYLGKSERKN